MEDKEIRKRLDAIESKLAHISTGVLWIILHTVLIMAIVIVVLLKLFKM